MMDIRYHVITIVAIFLALAVGITVGSAFFTGTSVERQVARGLEKEFGKLRAENRAQQKTIAVLNEQARKSNEFSREAVNLLVQKKLAHTRVAIIQTGDYGEATDSAKEVLETAGARIVSVTVVGNLDSAGARLARAASLISGDQAVRDPQAFVVNAFAKAIAQGDTDKTLETLVGKGLIRTSGDYDRRVFTIVLVGGSKIEGTSRGDTLDGALVEKLQDQGASKIVGVEPVNAATSYMSAYQSAGISTVDDIDQPMGQLSLVSAVAGSDGNFGVKRTADKLFPEFAGQER
jgi:hypothetical protein